PPPAPAPAPAPAGAAAATAAALSLFVVCPLNWRVGANSPSLCPTMFSVTYTGMNLRPLWTAMVCPTISGITVERRDHVLMTFFSPPRFITSTFSRSGTSTKGHFLSDLDIYFGLRCTMNRSVAFRFLVLNPLVGCPHGDTGCRPPDVLPSPPPSGWSTGFIATPRTCGRLPSHRLRPAFPYDTFSWSLLPTCPMVATHSTLILRISPDGIFTEAYSPSRATSCTH